MTKGHLKFRCYRCNQLLGTSSRRAGTVIACPRCNSELEIPRSGKPVPWAAMTTAVDVPSSARSGGTGSAAADRGTSGKGPSLIEEIAAAIPAELAALRPEDIRVEAEFAKRVVRTREPVAPVLASRAEAPPEPEAPSVEALPPLQTAQPAQMPRPVETPTQTPVRPDPPLSRALEQVQPSPLIDTALPAIQVEPPSILLPGRDIPPVSEVVLQPVTVLAWSLLVLMALPMAFLAGLLIGHFVWK
jgi:hypothetical protein